MIESDEFGSEFSWFIFEFFGIRLLHNEVSVANYLIMFIKNVLFIIIIINLKKSNSGS